MSFLRAARQPLVRSLNRTSPRVAFTQQRFATQDYGSGEQYKGKNPSEDKEHPGPPPPSTSKNSGGSQQGQQSQESQGSERSKEAQSSNSNKGASQVQTSKGTQGAKPKILDESPPPRGQEPDDVKKHNEEFDTRAEQAHEKVSDEDVKKDHVGKSFWSGHGGADRQP